jgi:hypothetical protein
MGSIPMGSTFLPPQTGQKQRSKEKRCFHAGIRTRVLWVKTTYPDQLDYAEDTQLLTREQDLFSGAHHGKQKRIVRDGIRTRDLLLRRETRCPLRHTDVGHYSSNFRNKTKAQTATVLSNRV